MANVKDYLDAFNVPGLPVLIETVKRAQGHLADEEWQKAALVLDEVLQASYEWRKALRELMVNVAKQQAEITELRKRRDDLLAANNRLVEERRRLVGLSSASVTVVAKEAYYAWCRVQWGGREFFLPDWEAASDGERRNWESIASVIVVAIREHVARQEREKLIELLGGER